MIVRCEICGESWQDGGVCGMCQETLFGEALQRVIDDGCEHHASEFCDECNRDGAWDDDGEDDY